MASAELRLEQDEIVLYPACPFSLPAHADLELLRSQHSANGSHKNISYNPHNGKVAGHQPLPSSDVCRLQDVLQRFSENARTWLAETLPHYAVGWQLDRVSLRPEEEATRQ